MSINVVTQSISDSSGLSAVYWATQALPVLRNNLALLGTITTDTEVTPGGFKQGKSINVPVAAARTSSLKADDSNPVNPTAATGSFKTLSLAYHRYSDFWISDLADAQATGRLMTQYIQPSLIAIAEDIERDLWTLVTDASITTTTGTAGTALTKAQIDLTAKKMTDNKVPMGPRHMVISTKDKLNLLSDSTLQTYFAYNANNPEAIREGVIGRINGFDIRETQLVPTTGSAPVSTHNVAYHPGAFLMAFRNFEPIQAPGVMEAQLHDTDSGIVLRMTAQYNNLYRATQVGIDVLYGLTILRPELACAVLT